MFYVLWKKNKKFLEGPTYLNTEQCVCPSENFSRTTVHVRIYHWGQERVQLHSPAHLSKSTCLYRNEYKFALFSHRSEEQNWSQAGLRENWVLYLTNRPQICLEKNPRWQTLMNDHVHFVAIVSKIMKKSFFWLPALLLSAREL